MSYTVEGVANVQAAFRRISDNVGVHLAKSYIKGAVRVQNDARKSIQTGSRTGKIYTVTKAGKTHQASAPGEPPKTDTGALVASIAIEPEANAVLVGTAITYGSELEFGRSYMAARPWLIPALERQRKIIEADIAQAVKLTIIKP